LNSEVYNEEALLEQIYKRYDHHFTKLRESNSMISINAQTNTDSPLPEEDKTENIPTNDNIRLHANKRAFQICPPSNTRNPPSTPQ
jgi:hypothetical protein